MDSTFDERTHPDHVLMMGVTVPLDGPFIMPDGSEMMQPLDGDGSARQVINCRCTFVAVLEGFDFEDILKDPT